MLQVIHRLCLRAIAPHDPPCPNGKDGGEEKRASGEVRIRCEKCKSPDKAPKDGNRSPDNRRIARGEAGQQYASGDKAGGMGVAEGFGLCGQPVQAGG